MLAIVIAFGIHSAIDWTWFFPGVAVPALACAGWLAGRGPLSEPIGRAVPKRLTKSPASAGIIVAIIAIAIAGAWIVWQPLRSSDADASAINELLAGRTDAALADAQTAVSADPVSADALWVLSEIHIAIGDRAAARADLVRATSRQPSNPDTWQRLGEFDLRYGQPRLAVPELSKAVALNLTSVQPLWDLSSAYIALHDLSAARAALVTAAVRQPRSPQAVLQLAQFDLGSHAPQSALPEFQAALALGAPAAQAKALIAKAQAAINAQHAQAAAAAKKAAHRRSGH
jgi:Tfp pilus assembly protein PilF